METTKPMTFGPKEMPRFRRNRLLSMLLSRRCSSPVALALMSFLSMITVGLLFRYSIVTTDIREHFPRALCKQETDVVIAVKTWPGHFDKRAVIRHSMGNPAVRAVLPWRVVFYTGYTLNPARSRTFLREILKGDLIITPFEAHVRNSANAFLSAARSVYERCGPSLRFFVHTNDSTMVDVLAMNKFISGLNANDSSIHCAVVNDVPVDRNVNSSMYMPESQIEDTHFPPHCEGDAFVVGAKHLKRLFLASAVMPPYPILGAYVTGHLAVLARLSLNDILAKITAISDEPWEPTSTPTERPLFVTNMTKLFQWKQRWFWDFFCRDGDDNITTALKEKVVERTKIVVK